jgi:hypothetical protein
MTQLERARLLWTLVFGAIVGGVTGTAYHAIFQRWKGDVRAPLVAAAVAGIVFVVITLVMLAWADRREALNKRGPRV